MGDVIELPARFWAKTLRVGECLEWTGCSNRHGYGRFRLNGDTHLAHRLVLGLLTGDPGHALHRCDNPPCVERSHLYVGTQADNTRDAMERGRLVAPTGAGNGKATDEDQVFDIRARRLAGQSIRGIADAHGVGHGWVSRVCRGLRWPDGPWPTEVQATELGYLYRPTPTEMRDNHE